MDRNYTVAPGDTLWDIAIKYYGNPTFWPAIFEYNNTKKVVEKTGTRIVDPDLILIKQKLIIPDVSRVKKIHTRELNKIKVNICRNRANHQQQGNEQSHQMHRIRQCQSNDEQMAKTPAKQIFPPAVEVDLGQFALYSAKSGGISIVMRATGRLLLQDTRPTSLELTVSNFAQLKVSAKHNAETAAGELTRDTTINFFNPKTKTVSFSNSLTSKSDLANSPTISLTAGTNAQGQPTLTGKMSQNIVKGRLTHHTFAGENISIEIEITAEAKAEEPEPDVATNNTTLAILRDNVITSGVIILAAGAAGLAVGTVIEDFRPVFGGVLNDPASFAIAGSMMVMAKSLAVRYTIPRVKQLSAPFLAAAGLSSQQAMAQPDSTKLFDD
ncbi:MAG: hypothetical protein COC05_05465 [Gammaproteobacteria bacterium]|nr:MAG: hypothetical protein COC05_05465 [Gammaproteobacteria bacterium]